MKKTILSIAIIAAAFLAASCQKENLQENIAPEGSASVFTATIESGVNTKTTVERVTSPSVAYKTYWESTDKISINGVTYTATPDATDATKATFTKDSGNDPTGTYKAYFPATMYDGTKATLPASYTYADGKYNMPMYAQSESTNLSFKNLCGVLAITVSNADFASVSSIEVSSDHQMNGEFTATPDGALSFESKTLTDDDKKVSLTFTSAKTIAVGGSATFYIPVPAGTHNPLTIKVSDGSTTKTKTTTKSGGVTVERNNVYPIVLNYPSGTLPGEFSVQDGAGQPVKQVHFSKGNLTCDISGATPDWKFYEHQYDCATGYDAALISLFTWGYDAEKSIDPDGTSYVEDHTTEGDSFDSTEDWGTQIGDGSTWRTLTREEWCYLFAYDPENDEFIEGHPRRQLFKYGVTVCGKANCIVLLPDGWVWNEATVGIGWQGEYNEASTGVKWSTMEAAGAVCLPAAGCRNGSSVFNVGGYGYYWSSTAYDSYDAYIVSFLDYDVYPDSYDSRGNGFSVRLITECQ